MRPLRPREVERRFWELLPGTKGVLHAGASVGVSNRVVLRWLAESGGVKPRLAQPRVRLSFQERCQIEAMDLVGLSCRVIARQLGRSPSTISRELRRNRPGPRPGRAYQAAHAQFQADRRARRPKLTKLAGNPRLCRQVQARLEQEHSPGQITARLKLDFPEDEHMRISPETIYKSLYVQGRGELRRDLAARLRTGRTLRRPRHQPNGRKVKIPGMINIAERPPEADDRKIPGHWEGDLLMGSRASNSAIGTLVERSSRYLMLLHLPDGHGADRVQTAMVAAMSALPADLRKTLTWDQGQELSNHIAIAAATDMDIYFCDPHSPWQRGSNENTNGLLRQYFPKGTDLSIHPPNYLHHIATKLNTRPRQTLHWRTPAETLDQLLSNPNQRPGVATTT